MNVSKVSQIGFISNYIKPQIKKKSLEEKSDLHLLPKAREIQAEFFQTSPPYQTVIFKGAKIHILDGGIHGKNMKFFAKSLKSDLEVTMHKIDINSKDRYTKQLKSLLEQLKKLNERDSFDSDEYIAIPCLSTVPLLNIQDQYNKVMGENIKITPENIKSNKEKILKFLKEIYNYPNTYREYINYMDSINCGIEYTYGVIQEINKLKEKCYRIYIPSGHPADLSLKWMADKRGLKPELYHYIATGEDIGNVIKRMQDEIKSKNWYSFNLLALSDAHIVGLKDTDWTKDFIFAGYDSCITESARGVYNFTPIRKGDKILGYSFHDEKTNEYPYSEFPMNKEILNLLEFVGKDKKEVLASKEETEAFKKKAPYQRKYSPYNKKLYKVEDVLSQDYIRDKKVNLLGKYTDYTLKVFYDENKDGKIVFKKTDCEGSGRPSVLTMWGSCFALFNAISNNIDFKKNYSSNYNNLSTYMKSAMFAKKQNRKDDYIKYLSKAAEAEKIQRPGAMSPEAIQVYEELAEIYIERRDYKNASGCLNRALYLLANQFYAQSSVKSLPELKRYHNIYDSSFRNTNSYIAERRRYLNASFFERLFMSDPAWPSNYDDYKKYEKENNEYLYYNHKFVALYKRLARVCEFLNESYPAKICKLAASDIEDATTRGIEIVKRRKDNNAYIGDLYSEVK